MSNQSDNPFLSNFPLAVLVRAVRQVGGETVTTPDTECARVWCRVENNRVVPPVRPTEELITANGALGSSIGLGDLQPY